MKTSGAARTGTGLSLPNGCKNSSSLKPATSHSARSTTASTMRGLGRACSPRAVTALQSLSRSSGNLAAGSVMPIAAACPPNFVQRSSLEELTRSNRLMSL